MRKRVYIETTIPSFYHTKRTDARSVARRDWTREWWRQHASEFEMLSSAAVIAELARGSSDLVKRRLRLMDQIELLEATQEVHEIVDIYVDRLVMPRDPRGDALHLALASFYKIDVLLTWNCRHLANLNKLEHIRVVNNSLGLPVPAIVTPMNLLNESGENA